MARGEDRAGCFRYRRRRLRPSRRPSGARDQRRRGRHPERCHRPLSRRHLLLSRDDDDDDDDVNDSADEEEEKWSDLLEQFDREAAVIADKARNKIVIPPHKVATWNELSRGSENV